MKGPGTLETEIESIKEQVAVVEARLKKVTCRSLMLFSWHI